MGEVTGIGWTDSTWNFSVGCTRVSAGCDHCYAYAFHDRQHDSWAAGRNPDAPKQYHRPFSEVQVIPERLTLPLKWKKPRRVFVNSMSDFFHKDIPSQVLIDALAVMALCPQHQFQILTKRPQRMKRFMAAPDLLELVSKAVMELIGKHGTKQDKWNLARRQSSWAPTIPTWPLPNVRLGVSVESDEVSWRIGELIDTPAAVRFLSLEPLIGPVDLNHWFWEEAGPKWAGQNLSEPGIDWVIVGGESGPGFREMAPEWMGHIVLDCMKADVPLFVKQDSGFRSGQQGRIPDSIWAIKQFPDSRIQKTEFPY